MKVNDSQINKVLDNEANPSDAKVVSEWFATPEGAAYLSAQMDREALELSDEQIEGWIDHTIGEDRMKQRFLASIKPVNKKRMLNKWWAVAVIIPLFFLGVASLFFIGRSGLLSATEYAELIVPQGEQMRVILQDGTIVHLNSDSRLKYPRQFGLFKRKVELSGEGYFDVAKDKSRPFIVGTEGMTVRVTGTSFNVRAYAVDSNIWVSLDEGGVILESNQGNEFSLVPGESAEYNRNSGECVITRPEFMDETYSWRSKSLNFYLTPLGEIVKVLERQYDISFEVSDSVLLNSRFTFSSSKLNIEDVLADLELVSDITFRKKSNGCFEISSK